MLVGGIVVGLIGLLAMFVAGIALIFCGFRLKKTLGRDFILPIAGGLICTLLSVSIIAMAGVRIYENGFA